MPREERADVRAARAIPRVSSTRNDAAAPRPRTPRPPTLPPASGTAHLDVSRGITVR